jgi:hypothetical protein
MVSRYTVIQYVPDPIADERINIGVVAIGETAIHVRFLGQWGRVQQFGQEDITFLRDFARRFQEAIRAMRVLPGLDPVIALTTEQLERMMVGWMNSIQFTSPRASLKSAGALLEEVVQRFLVEPQRRKRGYRDRQTAVAVTTRQIRLALTSQVDNADTVEQLLKRRHALEGSLDRHVYDVVVGNGVAYFAAQALSFELPDLSILKKTLDATAWAVDDVKGQNPDFPIAVMALPPQPGPESYPRALEFYERARKVYEGLGAKVLTEDQLEAWALPLAGRVSHDLKVH